MHLHCHSPKHLLDPKISRAWFSSQVTRRWQSLTPLPQIRGGTVSFSDLLKSLLCWWHSWKGNMKSQPCEKPGLSQKRETRKKSMEGWERSLLFIFLRVCAFEEEKRIIFLQPCEYQCVYNRMFFLCCLDASKNIPLWFVAVAVTLTAFAASRAGCVCNKSAQATDATLSFL